MLGFGLEQQGCYEGPAFEEKLGPDAWLDHGLVHARYFQGDDELDDALEFLQSVVPTGLKRSCILFSTRTVGGTWPLLHCVSRSFESAITIFDGSLWPDSSASREWGSSTP